MTNGQLCGLAITEGHDVSPAVAEKEWRTSPTHDDPGSWRGTGVVVVVPEGQLTLSCWPGEIVSGSPRALIWAIDCHETPCAFAIELSVSPLATV